MEGENKEERDSTTESDETEKPMNRAERRALEHNKKGAGQKPNALNLARGGSGGAMRGGGHANAHLPRTGHK
jgi:hypothetical protein